MKFGRKSILGGENYKAGREFMGGVLKHHAELKQILNQMCKGCRKRAKKAVMGKKLSDDYECDTWSECKVLLQKANDIGAMVSGSVKVN